MERNNETRMEEFRNSKYWNETIAKQFGENAACCLIAGYECLSDDIHDDNRKLVNLADDACIADLEDSFLSIYLPSRYMRHYTWDFTNLLALSLNKMMERFRRDDDELVQTVLDEVVLYALTLEAQFLDVNGLLEDDGEEWGSWIYQVGVDKKTIETIYDEKKPIGRRHPYHISHWIEKIPNRENKLQ